MLQGVLLHAAMLTVQTHEPALHACTPAPPSQHNSSITQVVRIEMQHELLRGVKQKQVMLVLGRRHVHVHRQLPPFNHCLPQPGAIANHRGSEGFQWLGLWWQQRRG